MLGLEAGFPFAWAMLLHDLTGTDCITSVPNFAGCSGCPYNRNPIHNSHKGPNMFLNTGDARCSMEAAPVIPSRRTLRSYDRRGDHMTAAGLIGLLLALDFFNPRT